MSPTLRNRTDKLTTTLFTSLDSPTAKAAGPFQGALMDLHGMMLILALGLRARVLAFDIAGTGETTVPMSGPGGAEIVSGLVRARQDARQWRCRTRGYLNGRIELIPDAPHCATTKLPEVFSTITGWLNGRLSPA